MVHTELIRRLHKTKKVNAVWCLPATVENRLSSLIQKHGGTPIILELSTLEFLIQFFKFGK